ncbi:MAG: peptide chain release factor 3 [Alphaproteobacteria bacterium]|nr:peptide chain release factor 3 [Alphaproteobacteria bacterium]MBQ9235305.1 peptide chain release factor 3 [Alphaproteobacteria bacterium]
MTKPNPRKTFAIISHPDAGKTTLTEKLLLFGGAIQQAGAVKARGEARRARSDWMKVEQERGISVASSVMTFDYDNITFNLLDTPGHEDFSEDTYRVLTAVDSAVMVLDSAKGIETQTKKLFEVCRLRDVPIITFINKLDREGQDPFALLDEIERTLALDVTPASWPVGSGKDFMGCYDILNNRMILMTKTGDKSTVNSTIETCSGLDDPKLDKLLPPHQAAKLREDVMMIDELCPKFDLHAYLEGTLTPVFFGSAINNFGVREVLEGLRAFAPQPRPHPAVERMVKADEPKVSGFIFKIQANMDPKHRDRIAFMRICSGHFKRGMTLVQSRTGKGLKVPTPVMFLAQERELAEDAYPGDIIGIPNHGQLRIGDSLTEGEKLNFTGIPAFAPELLKSVRALDPLKSKHLGDALKQIAEEGGASVFKPVVGAEWIVGVVGVLQFEVMADRIKNEFGLPVMFEPTQYFTARWVSSEDKNAMKNFMDANRLNLAEDNDGALVFLARNAWHLNKAQEDFPKVVFNKTKETFVKG